MPMKAAKMIHLLIKNGFIEIPKKGGHRKFVHPDGRTTEVPMHSKELTPYTQKKILKETGIKINK